jgi:hypothetical protein
VDSFKTFKSTVSATFNAVDLGGRGGGMRAGVDVDRLCSGGGPVKSGDGPVNGGGGPVNGGDGLVNGGGGPLNGGEGPVNGGGGPVNGGGGPVNGDGGPGNRSGGLDAGDTCKFNIPRLLSGLPPWGRWAKECRRRGREGGRREADPGEQLQPPAGGRGRPMAGRSSGDGTGRPIDVDSSGDGGTGRPIAARSSEDGMGRPAALGGRGGTAGSACRRLQVGRVLSSTVEVWVKVLATSKTAKRHKINK